MNCFNQRWLFWFEISDWQSKSSMFQIQGVCGVQLYFSNILANMSFFIYSGENVKLDPYVTLGGDTARIFITQTIMSSPIWEPTVASQSTDTLSLIDGLRFHYMTLSSLWMHLASYSDLVLFYSKDSLLAVIVFITTKNDVTTVYRHLGFFSGVRTLVVRGSML